MIIYQADKQSFLHDLRRRDIEELIHANYRVRTGRSVSRQELKSWAPSLTAMGKVLDDDVIPPTCGVAIEYTIPQTAKRIDFLLTGRNEEDRDTLVIVELKQWESAEKTEKDAMVVTRLGGGETETVHPSYQAWSYAALLEGYNEAVYSGGIQLHPCAYLYNYDSADTVLTDAFYAEHLERAPVFLKGQDERARLREFIRKHVRRGDGAQTLYRIEGGRIRPSRSLADALVGLLNKNREFVLVDDQKAVFETALQLARGIDKGKRVLIVEGGPGTGKSVLAVNLLVALTDRSLVAKYVTKNRAPRQVYAARLAGTMKKTLISELFVGSGAFTETPANAFDALIVDEAHRLNEKSGMYSHLGENQIMETIRASKLSVFFIDESQQVTLKDIGTKSAILDWARKLGASTTEAVLSSQFRCNGSDGYLAWIDNTLQVRPTANERLSTADFDFDVVDSPVALRDWVLEKNMERNRARMVAGYCWDWLSKKAPSAPDIVIAEHGFSAQWNFAKDEGLWIESPSSVDQIGCIHTCQGLELDYVGVIIGDDLVARAGQVRTVPARRSRMDQSIKGLKKLAERDPQHARDVADRIIKNTYRTLMTRGMRGCRVFCTDAETADYLRGLLDKPRADVPVRPILERTREVAAVLPFKRASLAEVRPYRDAVPILTLKIAAGAFGSQTEVEADGWAVLPDIKIRKGMFVAQVVGNSMNRRIPDGAWCLFRGAPDGSRDGRIVLVQHRDIADAETGGSFTVKKYRSEKRVEDIGTWRHERVVLEPDSFDPSHRPIVLTPGDGDEVQVIAEFVAVL
ncbi:MAG TPA: DNA/RNA helicase domain-containing protein [Candidatus Binatia bacterium]|nr:DNA/RNA helicase domain-containing protein [Candidatus Binatia bacterium]